MTKKKKKNTQNCEDDSALNYNDEQLLSNASQMPYLFQELSYKDSFQRINEDYKKKTEGHLANGGEPLKHLFKLILICPRLLNNPEPFDWVREKFIQALDKQRWNKKYRNSDSGFWKCLDDAKSDIGKEAKKKKYMRPVSESDMDLEHLVHGLMNGGLTERKAIKEAADLLAKQGIEDGADVRNINKILKRIKANIPERKIEFVKSPLEYDEVRLLDKKKRTKREE